MSKTDSYLWDSINEEWVEAPAVVRTARLVAVGQVAAGAHKLCWIDCNPAAGNSVWELSDDTTGLTAVVLDEFHTTREGHILNLNPPMPFASGIWLKTFTNMTSVTFGYI